MFRGHHRCGQVMKCHKGSN